MSAVPEAIDYRGAPDVMLNVLPTYHIAGVGVGLLAATLGGSSVLKYLSAILAGNGPAAAHSLLRLGGGEYGDDAGMLDALSSVCRRAWADC